MNKYKNITDHDLEIHGVGIVTAGGTIETTETLESANLELVEASGPVEGEIVAPKQADAPTITAPVASTPLPAVTQE